MKYNLYLDDLRWPKSTYNYIKDTRYIQLNWVVVRSYEQFVSYVKKHNVPEMVSFDHDIADEHYDTLGQSNFISLDEYYLSGDREMTGYDCAKWLCDYCSDYGEKFPVSLVHSMNKTGSDNIKYYINNFLKFNPELKK